MKNFKSSPLTLDNTNLSGIVGAMEVGGYKDGKSPYGLYDMAGNVWEWTSSDYNKEVGNKAVKGGSWGLSHRVCQDVYSCWV